MLQGETRAVKAMEWADISEREGEVLALLIWRTRNTLSGWLGWSIQAWAQVGADTVSEQEEWADMLQSVVARIGRVSLWQDMGQGSHDDKRCQTLKGKTFWGGRFGAKDTIDLGEVHGWNRKSTVNRLTEQLEVLCLAQLRSTTSVEIKVESWWGTEEVGRTRDSLNYSRE